MRRRGPVPSRKRGLVPVLSGATVVSHAFCSLSSVPALYELWMERLTAEAICAGTHTHHPHAVQLTLAGQPLLCRQCPPEVPPV